MSDEDLSKDLEEFFKEEGEGSEPNPEPEPTPTPEPEPEPEPQPQPEPEPTPEPQPEPTPEPEPTPTPTPEPEPKPPEPSEREKLLEAQIEDLQGKLLSRDTKPAEPGPKPKPPEPEPPKPLNFLGDQKLDEILDDPEKFNALLVAVHDKASDEGEKRGAEKLLRQIPELVSTYTSRHTTLAGLASDFYKKNRDLVGVKKTVAAVTSEIAAENPDLSVEKVFEMAAERTRKVLGLKGSAVVPPTPEPNPNPEPAPNPAFVDGKGGRKAKPSSGLKGLEKEIDDLLKD